MRPQITIETTKMRLLVKRGLTALAVSLSLVASKANAGPWEDGYEAYQRKDYAAAVQLWRIVANEGNREAQSLLGEMYAFGQGVPQDYARGIKWLMLAAEQNEPKAQYKLGMMNMYGQGFTKDFGRAAMWFILANASGHAKAKKQLAVVSEELSPTQIAIAQRLAQTCIKREYKGC